jgi:hypothetical protein
VEGLEVVLAKAGPKFNVRPDSGPLMELQQHMLFISLSLTQVEGLEVVQAKAGLKFNVRPDSGPLMELQQHMLFISLSLSHRWRAWRWCRPRPG